MTKCFRLSTLALAGTMLAGGSAYADTATSTMNVSATVTKLCEVTALPLEFGTTLDWRSENDTTSANISVTCTTDTPYKISIGDGDNDDTTTRQMKYNDGVDDHFMPYTLANSGSTDIPVGADATGDNYDVDPDFSGQGENNPVTHVVNGEVLAADLDDLPAGAYTDAVQVTVTY